MYENTQEYCYEGTGRPKTANARIKRIPKGAKEIVLDVKATHNRESTLSKNEFEGISLSKQKSSAQKLEHMNEEITQMDKQIETLKEENAKLHLKNCNLFSHIETLRQQLKIEKDKRGVDQTQREKFNKDFLQIDQLNLENEKLLTEKKELISLLDQREAEAQQLQSSNNQLETNIEKMTDQATDRDTKIKSLDSYIAMVNKDNENLKESTNKKSEEVVELRNLLQTEKSKFICLENEFNDMAFLHSQCKEKIKNVMSQIKTSKGIKSKNNTAPPINENKENTSLAQELVHEFASFKSKTPRKQALVPRNSNTDLDGSRINQKTVFLPSPGKKGYSKQDDKESLRETQESLNRYRQLISKQKAIISSLKDSKTNSEQLYNYAMDAKWDFILRIHTVLLVFMKNYLSLVSDERIMNDIAQECILNVGIAVDKELHLNKDLRLGDSLYRTVISGIDLKEKIKLENGNRTKYHMLTFISGFIVGLFSLLGLYVCLSMSRMNSISSDLMRPT